MQQSVGCYPVPRFGLPRTPLHLPQQPESSGWGGSGRLHNLPSRGEGGRRDSRKGDWQRSRPEGLQQIQEARIRYRCGERRVTASVPHGAGAYGGWCSAISSQKVLGSTKRRQSRALSGCGAARPHLRNSDHFQPANLLQAAAVFTHRFGSARRSCCSRVLQVVSAQAPAARKKPGKAPSSNSRFLSGMIIRTEKAAEPKRAFS